MLTFLVSSWGVRIWDEVIYYEGKRDISMFVLKFEVD